MIKNTPQGRFRILFKKKRKFRNLAQVKGFASWVCVGWRRRIQQSSTNGHIHMNRRSTPNSAGEKALGENRVGCALGDPLSYKTNKSIVSRPSLKGVAEGGLGGRVRGKIGRVGGWLSSSLLYGNYIGKYAARGRFLFLTVRAGNHLLESIFSYENFRIQ